MAPDPSSRATYGRRVKDKEHKHGEEFQIRKAESSKVWTRGRV